MRQTFRRKIAIAIIFLSIILFALYLYGLYNPSIPILMYHHVNEHQGDLVTIAPADFEKQMSYIKDNFNAIHLDELLSYLKSNRRFPARTCVITFDDGYYDNFAYAYPILKKYNLKATIFVTTSRIGEKRYIHEIKDHYTTNLEGALMASISEPSTPRGTGLRGAGSFLTWDELKEMEKTRIIDIQSHTVTHARYFVSPEIEYFNNNNFPWWLPLATGGDIRRGIPVYKNQKGLLARRYFDDKFLRNYLVRYAADDLFLAVKKYKTAQGNLKGRFETEEERKNRIKDELHLSKREIEERLNKECLFIAWPWGRYNEELIQLARSLGYQGAVTTEKGANISGLDPMYLKRFDIKKGNLRWFKTRLFMYRHGIIAKIYPVIRGK